MFQENVYTREQFDYCGTPMCHGGWYALASFTDDQIKENNVSFLNGSNIMTLDLGFEKFSNIHNLISDSSETYLYRSLLHWAIANKELWGNDNGSSMFTHKGAFVSEKRPDGANSLEDIIDHWEEVYGRVRALEEKEEKEKNKNIYPNITEKLAVLPVEERPDCEIKQLIHN